MQSQIETLRLQPEFAVFAEIPATVADAPLQGEAAAFWLRLGLEEAFLVRVGVPAGRAWLAAARAASQFALVDGQKGLPGWAEAMAADLAPSSAFLEQLCPAANTTDAASVRAAWADLGTADALMETGGDIRLQRDSVTALNGYGCSHRPRPWAVTFASSTASSSSERGYKAADEARLRVTAALLTSGRRAAVAQCLEQVRAGIKAHYGLPPEAHVVLAASGTDTELLALALTHMGDAERKVRNILIAPAETGKGVPMAARGVHFAVNTALGAAVTQEAAIDGFRPDTEVTNVSLRRPEGGLREARDVEAEILAAVSAGIAAGAKVLVHGLDLSKTGLLAPGLAFLRHLRGRFGAAVDIVIDACQARISAASVRDYLALDAVVLTTGSKFFTGPPFAGAAILPPAVAERLRTKILPAGLEAYFGRDEFPVDCPAACALPAVGNYGLALRWHAALAEMRAFAAVPAARRAEILTIFSETVRMKIAENPALRLLRRPELARGESAEAWETLRSIFTFSLVAPHDPGRNVSPAEARLVYLWLNADLSDIVPGEAASRICHIGQPVSLPQDGGAGTQGVLRVSAGARLIAGEPSHERFAEDERIAREMADLCIVFDKIALILAHWEKLCAADPMPCYRAAAFA